MPIPNSAGKGLSRQSLNRLAGIVQSLLRKYDDYVPVPASQADRQAELDMLAQLKLEIEQELASPRTTVLAFPRFAPPDRCKPVTTVICEINEDAELIAFQCKAIEGADTTAAAIAAGRLGYHVGNIQSAEGGSRA